MDVYEEHAAQRRRKAAWLFAQFTVAKTTSLKKTHGGADSNPRQRHQKHEAFTDRAPKLGGLVEFYRSPARVAWTPTGTNVPDYPKLCTAVVAKCRRGGFR